MKKSLLYLLFLTSFLALPLVSMAAQCPLPPALTGTQWIECVVNNFINLLLWPIFFALVIFMSLWVAVLYLTSKGEPDKITKANKALMWLLIGVAVALFAFSVIATVRGFLGLNPPPPP